MLSARRTTLNNRRQAFTLLEVLLASAIALLLMGALYVAVDIQLKQAQAGREVIEEITLTRALLARISADVSATVGPLQSSPSTGATAGATTGTTTTGTTSTTGTTDPTTASTTGTTTTTSTTSAIVNIGVQGDGGRLVLFLSRVPRELNVTPEQAANEVLPLVSDLRRVTYWLVGNETSAVGLARQEYKIVTSDEAINGGLPDGSEDLNFVIAEEVKSLGFQYFDGTTWTDTWDGSLPGTDGVTPMGPPVAIAVTLGIYSPGMATPNSGETPMKMYRRVIPIPTANGTALTPATTTTTGQ